MTIKRQTGMTLFTSLAFLLVMTALGLTAIKLSTLDMAVARNYQHELTVYHTAKSTLRQEVQFSHLYQWMLGESHYPRVSHKNKVSSQTQVIDLNKQYTCKNDSIKAESIGLGAAPCRLYLFTVESRLNGTGARNRQFQGAGKQVPNASRGSYL